MIESDDYDKHMDDLALRIGEFLHEEDHHDVASACSLIVIYSLCELYKDPVLRQQQLERVIQFMREMMLRAEADGVPH